MKKILRAFIGILTLLLSQVYAQDLSVTGKVTDDNQSELPGVNVTVKGSTKGTTTDNNGNYTIAVSKGNTLVFSFIGFNSQEIFIDNQTILNVKLAMGPSFPSPEKPM